MKIYDILGKQIAELINEKQNAGTYEIEFNASDLPSGIYFYELGTDNFKDTRRMVLLK